MGKSRTEEKINIEEILQSGKSVRFKPQGYSMYPLIVPGRDDVDVIPVKPDKIRRGDVILYRRPNDRLIIHRVYKIQNGMLYMVGDNQSDIEGPLPKDCVRGIMVRFTHNGKHYNTDNFFYFLSWQIWLFALPFRNAVSSIIHRIKKVTR